MASLTHDDYGLLQSVNELARDTPWLHTPVLDYATYGVVLFGALLLAAVVLRRHGTDRMLAAAGWAGVAVVIAVALNQPLVAHFAEPRPYTTHPGLLVLATRSADPSFPSDHAVMAGAAAAGLWLSSRALGAIATAAAVAMALSRVYIAAHYPWDVAAGLVLGAAIALLGWLLLRRPLTALTAWLRQLPGLDRVFGPDAGAPAAGPLAGTATT